MAKTAATLLLVILAVAAPVSCDDPSPAKPPDTSRCSRHADCDDDNPCTDDTCGAAGSCEHLDNNAPCDDGLFCNGSDSCSGGACAIHEGDPCSGGTECADRCDEDAGSCDRPAGHACGDDGDDCTDDLCDGTGECTHPNSSLCTGLVAWWTFDEPSGSTANDRVGDNTGRLLPDAVDGPSRRRDHNCVTGGCLVFDGEDDAVACGEDASLAITGDISISLWVSPDSWVRSERLISNGLYEIFHRGQWAGDRVYFLYRVATQPPLGDSAWDHKAGVHSGRDLPLGRWHHLVAVKRGQQLEIWLDGVRARVAEDLVDQSSISADTLGPLRIGGGPEPFAGTVDDLRIYGRALSPAEICEACRQHSAAAGNSCCQPQCVHFPDACTEAACSDGLDNDDDGRVDARDPGCQSASDPTETLQAGDFTPAPIAQHQQKLDAFYQATYPNEIIETFPYNLSRALAGLVSLYEATQQARYVELALKNVEAVIDKMVDVDGDGRLEWDFGPSQWDHDNDPATPTRASCLYTQKSIKHFARLARVILHDDALSLAYGDRARAVVSTIKREIINDPHCRGRFEPGYGTVHHIVSHPLGVLLELYLLEGDQRYLAGESYTTLATITTQANALRDTLFAQADDPRAVEWGSTRCVDLDHTYPDCYFVNLSEHPACQDSQGTRYCRASDVSHANEFVFTAIELYRAGVAFTRADIDALVYTFVNKIWDGDLAQPNWRDFVDGHNEPPGGKYGPWRMGRNIPPGWVGLGAFDQELQLLLELGVTLPRTNKQTFDQIGYYGELARNQAAGDCRYSNGAREIADGVDNDCDGLIDE